ncbi:hypothetical protein FRC06_009892 [Ceratobasidium sp. 370]|nr:hypothetical protein FRC06_009892 [Ceratobasidium sp. 370]
MDSDTKFEKTALNTVRRRPDRGVYDKQTISAIIREARVMHVAFVDASGLPQCIPMLGAWHEDETGQCYLYFHGYPTTRILSALSDTGTPVVATTTIVDGLVLALSAFSHSMNYRSAVVHGVVLPISSAEEKQDAFRLLVDELVPGRWDASRQPDEEESDGTGILRVKVETARQAAPLQYVISAHIIRVTCSAKIRAGPPKDDKKVGSFRT